VIVIGEWSLPVLVSTHESFVVFFLPVQLKRGSDKVALVGTWHPARLNHYDMSVHLILRSNFK